MKYPASLAAVCCFLGAAAVSAQDLVTDRPDQTESAVTVPAGRWQVESGVSLTHGDDVEVEELAATLVRVGLAENFELRLGWAGLIRERGPGEDLDGAGDGELGAKLVLREENGAAPQLAVIAGTSVPFGERGVSSERFDPALRLCVSRTLSQRLSLGANVGAEWSSEVSAGGGRSTGARGIYTVTLGAAVGERTGAFVELFGDFSLSQHGPPAHTLDGGVTFLVREDLQVDVAAGVGLSEAAPDWFVGVGVSWRAR